MTEPVAQASVAIDQVEAAGAVTVRGAGVLGARATATVTDALDGDPTVTVVDLSGVQRCDYPAQAVLIDAARSARAGGVKFYPVAHPFPLRHALLHELS